MNGQVQQDQQLSPLNVVMTFLVIATFLGVCFFTSPPPGKTPEGAIPWQAGSVLKTITDLLAFDFTIPTPQGFAVKGLVAGLASGLAIIVVAVGTYLARRTREHDFTLLEEDEQSTPTVSAVKKQIEPLLAAQLLLGIFVGLSFLSAFWSPMPVLATGGSILLLSHCLWVFALRFGLSPRTCAAATVGLVAILACAAGLAIWYYYERNPTMRVGYPIGNPLFFAACMIPATLLSFAWMADSIQKCVRGEKRGYLQIGLCLLALVPICWGVKLADPRGTYLAIGVGLVAMVFFAVQGWRNKLAVLSVALVLAALTYVFWLGPKIASRNETVRTRLYAWGYGQELLTQHPFRGHGQGGYTLLADSLAINDVADDPRALHTRIAHAHNEWLETLVDLGSIGLVVILGCYALTLLAGVRLLRTIPDSSRRWLLIGLMATLAAMLTEECLDVALRITGFPTVFYAILGMTWVLIASNGKGRPAPARPRKSAAQTFAMVGVVVLGLFVSGASLRDFEAARALYSHYQRLENRQWSQAVEEVEQAMHDRLSPNRKLAAQYAQAACHLRVADAYLRNFLQKNSVLDESSPHYERMLETVKQYEENVIAEVESALASVGELTRNTGHFYGVHALTGNAYQITARLAHEFGKQELFQESNRLAAEAFRRELARRPFDADLVLQVIALSPELSLAEITELMCRPMQYHQVGQMYFQLIQSLSQKPNFDNEFRPILAQALTALIADQPPGADRCNFPSEKLRIAAWVAVSRGGLKDARAYAKSALDLAENQKEMFPISPAVTSRELAHYTFLCDPHNPQVAIGIALRGKDFLPDSHEAEPARRRIDKRLAIYYLASGNEDAAKKLIPKYQQLKPEARDAELAQVYLSLFQIIFLIPPAE